MMFLGEPFSARMDDETMARTIRRARQANLECDVLEERVLLYNLSGAFSYASLFQAAGGGFAFRSYAAPPTTASKHAGACSGDAIGRRYYPAFE